MYGMKGLWIILNSVGFTFNPLAKIQHVNIIVLPCPTWRDRLYAYHLHTPGQLDRAS